MEELFWSVWQLNTLMCGFSGQSAKLSSAPVPVPSNSTKRLSLSVVIRFYQRGMCLIGLKYLFPLTFSETFSTTAKASMNNVGLCGCFGKSKQDEAVSQSSEVCVAKKDVQFVYLLFNTHSGLFFWEIKRQVLHLDFSVAALESVMSGWQLIKHSKNLLKGQVDILRHGAGYPWSLGVERIHVYFGVEWQWTQARRPRLQRQETSRQSAPHRSGSH